MEIKMNKIVLLTIFLVIITSFFLSPIFAQQSSQTSQTASTYPPEADPNILRARFSEFSTSNAFVLVKIKNAATDEVMSIVLSNSSWYYYAKRCNINIPSETQAYVEYMIENYDKPFTISDEAFKCMKIFKADSFYQYEGKKGKDYLINKYFESGGEGLVLTDRKIKNSNALMRVFLENNILLKTGCYSNAIFIPVRDNRREFMERMRQ